MVKSYILNGTFKLDEVECMNFYQVDDDFDFSNTLDTVFITDCTIKTLLVPKDDVYLLKSSYVVIPLNGFTRVNDYDLRTKIYKPDVNDNLVRLKTMKANLTKMIKRIDNVLNVGDPDSNECFNLISADNEFSSWYE